MMAEVLKDVPMPGYGALEKGKMSKNPKISTKVSYRGTDTVSGTKEDIGSYYQGMDVLYCPPDLKDFLL